MLSVATLGIGALEKQVNPLGYMGKGWTYHSQMKDVRGNGEDEESHFLSTTEFTSGGKEESNEDKAVRLVLMEDLFGKIKAVKKLLADRVGGPKLLDWLSGIPLFVGDGILQSLIGIGSRVAIWLTALSLILHLINIPDYGALSPVIAILSALALSITYVRMALAGVKLSFTAARTAVDSLNLATNDDPRMTQALQARTISSGTRIVGDSMQMGGLGLVLAGDSLMGELHKMTDPFNPVSDVQNVGHEYNQVLMEELHSTAGEEFSGFADTSLGEEGAREATFAGGAATAIVGADVVPVLAEVADRRTELYNPEHRYLGGSNPKSHKHQEGEGYQGPQPEPPPSTTPSRTPAKPRGGPTNAPKKGKGRTVIPPLNMNQVRLKKEQERFGPDKPSWLVEGTAAQQELRSKGKEHLKSSADLKVKAVSNAVSDPVSKAQAASDAANNVSQKLQSVKDVFSKDAKKDSAQDLPKDIIKKAEKSEEDSKDTAKLSDVLSGSAKTLVDVGAVAKEGLDVK
jgi:hypothetical protein